MDEDLSYLRMAEPRLTHIFREGRVCARCESREVTHKITAEQNGQRVTMAYLCEAHATPLWPEQLILGLPPFMETPGSGWHKEVSDFDVEVVDD